MTAAVTSIGRDILLTVVALSLASCRGPDLRLESPSPAVLLVDGSAGPGRRAGAPATLDYRYYGTAEVRALPRAPTAGAEGAFLPHAATTEWVDLPPPAPKWLFPFDLLIELARLPWRADEVVVEVALEPNPDPVADDSIIPRGLDDLRERALRARLTR